MSPSLLLLWIHLSYHALFFIYLFFFVMLFSWNCLWLLCKARIVIGISYGLIPVDTADSVKEQFTHSATQLEVMHSHAKGESGHISSQISFWGFSLCFIVLGYGFLSVKGFSRFGICSRWNGKPIDRNNFLYNGEYCSHNWLGFTIALYRGIAVCAHLNYLCSTGLQKCCFIKITMMLSHNCLGLFLNGCNFPT